MLAGAGPRHSRSLLRSWRCVRSFSSTAPNRADFSHVVIGGGVVGIATARALAQKSSSASSSAGTLLLERHGIVGSETSSRNSEVIHAGLYYGPGTLKTRLCIEGKEKLYAFCAARGVGHANVGKWIVAQNDAEREALERLHAVCRDVLGVPTRWVNESEAKEAEPAIRADAGVLESPTTGIVDSHGLMVALQGEFEEAGGVTALNSTVTQIQPLEADIPGSKGWRLTIRDSTTGEESTIETEAIINSAGLAAADIHNMIVPPAHRTRLYYAKGNYFSYAASQPRVRRLVYPTTLAGAGGLGTHLTLDLAGRLRFGPDVEWVDDASDLNVNTARFPDVLTAVRRYLPDIDETAFSPDYAGIRPKLGPGGAVGTGKGFYDFHIKMEDGYAGWVNMLGMESPGLTSSIAIGDYVRDLFYGTHTGS
ncbi:FAD dependent oxidoreductase [Xylaria bambusicola]|uniref:FAD dependent oxidoreductase n=1 Tax=Xylaria bambusicola TaxID=326684 RepID=UPI00200821D9|nr:FAD dependent oxidoreductase [Xylaria bambusicola]KAI0521450.1 FAD dependent oxidoreductase [Xylaria bambusicola]